MQKTLIDLIKEDPDNKGYTTMTAQEIAKDITWPRHSTPQDIEIKIARMILIRRAEWYGISRAANNPDHPATALAWIVMDMARYPDDRVNFHSPQDADVINRLSAAGLVRDDCLAALQAACTRPSSLADIHGLKNITTALIESAIGE